MYKTQENCKSHDVIIIVGYPDVPAFSTDSDVFKLLITTLCFKYSCPRRPPVMATCILFVTTIKKPYPTQSI